MHTLKKSFWCCWCKRLIRWWTIFPVFGLRGCNSQDSTSTESPPTAFDDGWNSPTLPFSAMQKNVYPWLICYFGIFGMRIDWPVNWIMAVSIGTLLPGTQYCREKPHNCSSTISTFECQQIRSSGVSVVELNEETWKKRQISWKQLLAR